jgi:hypothetical protein
MVLATAAIVSRKSSVVTPVLLSQITGVEPTVL